jgi:hypothetical protein
MKRHNENYKSNMAERMRERVWKIEIGRKGEAQSGTVFTPATATGCD